MRTLVACLFITAGLALGSSALGANGTISTVAGDGSGSFGGDGGQATLASLNYPEGVAATPDGGFLIADTGNCRIRRVTPLGTIETVAGGGNCSYNGDGGDATLAKVKDPRAAVPTPDGGFLIADTGNRVVRRVSPSGTISTVAGTGAQGSDGDGGPAASARLGQPDDIAPTPGGGFLIADYEKHVVRRVSASGTISTVAGDSSQFGSTGDGGPATDALLDTPADVETLPDGGFLIAAHGSGQLRHVRADGVIVNFAGTGQNGFAGDGGPATAAELYGPHALSLTQGGDVLIADGDNHRIRSVDADFVPPPADEPAPGDSPAPPAPPVPSEESPVAPLEPASEPVLGVSVVVAPSFGQVMVKLPGGKHWLALEDGTNLPVGTRVKALMGSVILTSAVEGGQSQTGTFWGGVFEIGQARGGNGMTDIKLRGGDFGRCRNRARRAGPSALTSRTRRPVRRLWAKDDHGRFRTHGRDSVATTRGTLWLTEDRCKGTATRVKEGQVRVRHRHSRRSVLVSAGERYLASSRRR